MNRNDQQFIAQKIRTQYMEQQAGELDALRALDSRVKRPVNVFSYIFGSVGAIIMGTGMSLVMTDLAAQLGMGDMTVPGVIIGIVGLALALVNYPIHKAWLRARKKKYAPQIIEMSDKMLRDPAV